jgi:hypothetical protein
MIFAECYDFLLYFHEGHEAVHAYEYLKNQVDMLMFP